MRKSEKSRVEIQLLLRFIFEKHAGPAIFPISLTKIMLNEQTKIERNFRECMCVFMKNCNEFAHEDFLEVLFISVEICRDHFVLLEISYNFSQSNLSFSIA